MDETTKAKLAGSGWAVGSADEFLNGASYTDGEHTSHTLSGEHTLPVVEPRLWRGIAWGLALSALAWAAGYVLADRLIDALRR